jgi:hypothetical protein
MPLPNTKSIPDLKIYDEAITNFTPSKQVNSPKIKFDKKYFQKKNREEQQIHYGDRQRLEGTNDSPDQETVMRHANELRKEQRKKWNEKNTAEAISFGRYPQYYPDVGLQLSPLKQDPITPPYIKITKPNQEIMQVDQNYHRYGDHTDNERLIPGNYGSPEKKSGGKSKRIKSKTKSCCSVRKSAKVCRRKTDNKKFRLPRRFSRKTCLAKKPRGFTMRSSCAPYKGCNKTRKCGVSKKNKNGGHHELLLLASLLFAKKKSKTKSKTKKQKNKRQ